MVEGGGEGGGGEGGRLNLTLTVYTVRVKTDVQLKTKFISKSDNQIRVKIGLPNSFQNRIWWGWWGERGW